MSVLSEPITKRIGKLVRMFGSSFENERYIALAKLKRLLDEEGLSFSDIAIVIENADGEIEELKYSDRDAEAIFLRGVEKGRAKCHERVLSAQYFDDDGDPRWIEIVMFCQNHQVDLNPKEQEFIDEMSVKLRWRSPSLAQGGYLLSIFWKLRGSLK